MSKVVANWVRKPKNTLKSIYYGKNVALNSSGQITKFGQTARD
jgi:hypothetical protein